ncbi:MAG: TnsA-like heteromeric transposase endonuclease subunit [Micromonosporaceae bacterium]
MRDLTSMPMVGCEPVRRFGWRAGQRHRPGLQYLVSTRRHHGFESVAEQRLLLVLDFAAGLVDVLSQPFRLRFATVDGWREHTPDFLAVTDAGTWVIDVRPGDRIGEDDRVGFAATGEVALSCGWRYAVVAGWRPHVLATVDTLSAQRRWLADPLGLQAVLLESVAGAPRRFGELVAGTAVPAVARAHLLHLLWWRRLGTDLTQPLTDGSTVWSPSTGGAR